LLISIGAFIGSPSNDPITINQSMLQVALTGKLPKQQLSNYRNRQGALARIELDNSRNIKNIDSQISLNDVNYDYIVQQILSSPNNSGTIKGYHGQDFLYLYITLKTTNTPVIIVEEILSTTASLKNFIFRITPTLLLVLALVPIQRAWQQQAAFTADASHELRTPLSIIQTNLECAIDDTSETIGENMNWLDNIKSETKRMSTLVNDLLTLSRSDSNEQMLLKENIFFDILLQDTLNIIIPFAKQNNISIQRNIKPDLQIHCDKELLKRLIVILVDNSIKYTPQNGIIKVSAIKSNKDIIFKVSDTGIGIAPQHLDKIFDRFYRVDEFRSSNIESSGLGLSLAKWIVQMHSATISVKSQINEGSEFTVIFHG